MYKNQLEKKQEFADFIIQTGQHRWAIPPNCRLLKLLLEQQNIGVNDLVFYSHREYKQFIKQLFLLALEDEHANQAPSPLASFGRRLLTIKTNLNQLN